MITNSFPWCRRCDAAQALEDELCFWCLRRRDETIRDFVPEHPAVAEERKRLKAESKLGGLFKVKP